MARRFCTLLRCVSQTVFFLLYQYPPPTVAPSYQCDELHSALLHNHRCCTLKSVCCSASGTAFTDKERKEKG